MVFLVAQNHKLRTKKKGTASNILFGFAVLFCLFPMEYVSAGINETPFAKESGNLEYNNRYGLTKCINSIGQNSLLSLQPLIHQAELIHSRIGGMVILREGAQGMKVWHLEEGNEANYVIILPYSGKFQLRLRYVNPSESDKVLIEVNERHVGSIITENGEHWSGEGGTLFLDSYKVPLGTLQSGLVQINIKLEASEASDRFGLDVDYIEIIKLKD